MTKSVLVTGATGFIGSRLVDELIKKGYEVTSLVRKGKEGNPKSNIIYGDLTDKKIDFKDLKFNCVFHLASHTPLEKNKKINKNRENKEKNSKILIDQFFKLTGIKKTKILTSLNHGWKYSSNSRSLKVKSYWNNKLNQIEEKADSEQWIEASELLDSLSKELQSFEKSKSEALELYLFLESEWFNLRKKLESSNIKANDEMRISAESKISECKKLLDQGEIDSTLSCLGETDEIIENLRRRI